MANYLDTTGLTYFWGKIKAYISGLGFYTKPSTGIPASDIASGVIPTVPSNVSAFINDAGYITSYTETDPTVPSWAKAASKPSYTASEVGAVPTTRTVNGKALSTDITLSASDVNALPSSTIIPSAPGTLNTTATTAQSTNSSEALSGSITLHKVAKTGAYSDLIGTPTIPTVPANLIIGTNGSVTNIQVISDANYNALLLNGTTNPTTLYIITAS